MRQRFALGVVVAGDQLLKWWWLQYDVALLNQKAAWWLVAALVVGYLWWKKKGWPWELIIGGGLSNLIDRLVRGGVVDGPWGFNLADVAIIVGSLWLIANRK